MFKACILLHLLLNFDCLLWHGHQEACCPWFYFLPVSRRLFAPGLAPKFALPTVRTGCPDAIPHDLAIAANIHHMSRTVGIAKVIAEHGATSEGRSALFQSSGQ